jgi:alkylhydroperoxidase/carboxymuconolactone decarboxylase family protein YurZ
VDQRHEELLRRLSINDESTVEAVMRLPLEDSRDSSLDARTRALVRVASLVALQSSEATLGWAVTSAFAGGATDDDIVGVLLAVAPVVGLPRLNRAAVAVATALGCDLDVPDEP